MNHRMEFAVHHPSHPLRYLSNCVITTVPVVCLNSPPSPSFSSNTTISIAIAAYFSAPHPSFLNSRHPHLPSVSIPSCLQLLNVQRSTFNICPLSHSSNDIPGTPTAAS